MYHIELLSPKQETADLEGELEKFAARYLKILGMGHVVCIPDNPMGNLAFQGTELIEELKLPVKSRQVSIHLNTFHSKSDLEWILESARSLGIENILIISGDGSERLPKLKPEDLQLESGHVTAVELIQYVKRRYGDKFNIGAAFNPYEPQGPEMEKMRRKMEAGAQYVTTQPVIGHHPAVDELMKLGLPTIIEAWMSRKLYLLSDCIGYEIPQDINYNPLDNLRNLVLNYPGCGFYLSFLGFKSQLPLIDNIWNETHK
ncbi:MAG: methylenetetrahydrofolate reductase [Lentisphaeria bacterium]